MKSTLCSYAAAPKFSAPLRRSSVALLPLWGLIALAGSASAASISAGNLVIYRVGDGTAALSSAATAVFIDEYTPAGSLVQSIPVAGTGAAGMTAAGNATTEGVISRSQDGTSLIFTGYRGDVGTAAIAGTAPATTGRVIATLGTSGVVNTAISLNDTTATIRSATSVDGVSSFYVSTSTSVRYVGSPSGSASSVSIDNRNSRQVQLSGGTLYASNGSTTIAAKVQTYGTLPTAATAGTAAVTLALTDAVNGFVLLDLNSGVAGDDTMYLVNAVTNTLLKYSFDGTAWNAAGSIAASGVLNLTGAVNGGNANLYLTSAGSLFSLTDGTGSTGTLAGSLTTIATAGTNTAFRGIGAFAPVPETSTTLLGVLAMAGILSRRRRK